MDFEVSVKWGVGLQQETPAPVSPTLEEEQLTPEETFRLAGAQLRMIADSFQSEVSVLLTLNLHRIFPFNYKVH